MLVFGKHAMLAHISVLTANIESLQVKSHEIAELITQLSAESEVNVLTAKIATLDYKFTNLEKECAAAQTTLAYLQELVQNFASLQERSNALSQ